MGRGQGPLRATRDRTPPNAPRDSWRCESIGSEHRRCLAVEPTFVGIEQGTRDGRKRSTERTWLHFGVLIGAIQRRECRNDDLRLVFREFPILGPESKLAARAALASPAQGLYWPFHRALLWADAPSTSITSSPSPAPSASMPNELRATWKLPPWMR